MEGGSYTDEAERVPQSGRQGARRRTWSQWSPPRRLIERFRRRDAELEALGIKTAQAGWAEENVDVLPVAEPEIPAELNDRAADVWEPPLAIAQLSGCGDRARTAALHLSGAEEEPDPGVQLLTDQPKQA
jgi:Protein of unknown function (DUF3631)